MVEDNLNTIFYSEMLITLDPTDFTSTGSGSIKTPGVATLEDQIKGFTKFGKSATFWKFLS